MFVMYFIDFFLQCIILKVSVCFGTEPVLSYPDFLVAVPLLYGLWLTPSSPYMRLSVQHEALPNY